MKIVEIQNIYNLLANAKTDGLTVDEKYKVVTLSRTFKKVVEEFQSFVSDLREKDMTDEEKNQIATKEVFKEVENFKYDKLGETFDKLIAANNWTVIQIDELEKILK